MELCREKTDLSGVCRESSLVFAALFSREVLPQQFYKVILKADRQWPIPCERCCSCRWRRCKLSLCSPFQPFLQERKALKSKVSAISQYWVLTWCMGPYRLYFFRKQSQVKHCLNLDKAPSKIKCLEDFLVLHPKIDNFWKSHAVFCTFDVGLFCFSSLPVELFDFRVLKLPVVEESIGY